MAFLVDICEEVINEAKMNDKTKYYFWYFEI